MRPADDDRARVSPAAAVHAVVTGVLARRASELGVILTAFFGIVVVVAGGSAVALLARPALSGSYFSWDLGAPPTAATIGGLYLASAATFGVAVGRSRSQVRSLSVGVLALALPTLWFTMSHRAVFDWARPQAVAWAVLLLCAPVAIALDLRAPAGRDHAPSAGRGPRVTLAVVAVVFTIGAGVLWIEPLASDVAAHSPLPIVGLTGRYLGAWCAFLATGTATAAVRGRTSDVRLAAVLLGSVSIGSLAAAVRTAGDLGPNAAAYVAAMFGIGIVAAALHRSGRRADPPTIDDPEPNTITTRITTDERIRP